MMNKEEIRVNELVNDSSISLDKMYSMVLDECLGDLDSINNRETIEEYINEMMQENVMVSHMLVAIENSNSNLFEVWLGNSMETPEPIENKEDLKVALGY